MLNTMTGARDNVLIRDFGKEICRLPARGFGTTEFDMPQTKIDALVEAGRLFDQLPTAEDSQTARATDAPRISTAATYRA